MYGKYHTEETKEKMSDSKKGKKLSKEHREKLSLVRCGFLNPNWRGGISTEPYCIIWEPEYKDFIKERDGYQCLNPMCNRISKRLAIHHINYVKKDCEPKNLITLCNSCNSRANYNRNSWKTLYQLILNQKYNYQYLGEKI